MINQRLKFTLLTGPLFQVLLWEILEQKYDFNTKKQVLLLTKLRPCLLKNKRYYLFSIKKLFMSEIFFVLKLRAFYFEISAFSSPGCRIGFILHLLLLVSRIQSIARFYSCTSRVHRRRGLNFSKIVANLYKDKLQIL